MPKKSDHPEIEALLAVIRKHNIRIQTLPETPLGTNLSYRRLALNIQGTRYTISVDDEYKDVRNYPQNTALMLHLILRACEDYMDAEDYLVWCKDSGLSPELTGLRDLYFELRDSVPRILERIKEEAKPISSWDFTMNTGVTQVLRAIGNE